MAEHRIRTDGWTAERQAAFLAELARTRSVTAAARAVGMGREGAHRLRGRRDGALFAHLWDLAVALAPVGPCESHTASLTDGQLARLLGNEYRRESGDFDRFAAARSKARAG